MGMRIDQRQKRTVFRSKQIENAFPFAKQGLFLNSALSRIPEMKIMFGGRGSEFRGKSNFGLFSV